MSFDNHYPNRKDHRKPYRGSASFDPSCRHGGSCPYCHGNRTISKKRIAIASKLAQQDGWDE